MSRRTLPSVILLIITFLVGVTYFYLNRNSSSVDNSQQRILVIGNSFTYQNNLDQMIGNFIEAQSDGAITVDTGWVAFGGYHLFDHMEDVRDGNSESPLRSFLLDGSPAETDWDLVVFQEQVEIPGLPTYSEAQSSSIFAATALGKYAHELGADVIVLETWGNGFSPEDPENPYPEFPAMQNQIAFEVLLIVDEMINSGIPAELSPAGDAFLIVYQDTLNSGFDPYADGSPFMQLFAEDQEHSSLAGTYLAAAVVAASYTNRPIIDAVWDQPNVEDEFELYLRQVADRAVFGE